MSSQDAAVSEDSTSDSKPQDGEPSVISSENHTHRAFSLIGSEKGYWILPRSGMTSKPSTESLGVESWIASLRESRVSPILTPESVVVNRMIETYGLICGGSLARWNPELSWWKTSQVSLVDLEPTDFVSSETSNGWVMSWSNELYLPEQSEHRTVENESLSSQSLLPTVVASDTWVGNLKSSQQKDGSRHSVGSVDALKLNLPTLAPGTHGRGGSPSKNVVNPLLNGEKPSVQALTVDIIFVAKGKLMGVKSMEHIKKPSLNLPTPNASDAEGGATETTRWENGRMVRTSETTGTKFGAKLRDLAKTHEHMISPISMPSKESASPKNSSDEPIYLNPSFGEAMMGFPIGWTALKESETLLFLKSHFKSQEKSKG